MALKIGIIELRNLVKTIHDKYGVDFSNYAMTSFKRRVSTFAHNKSITDMLELIDALNNSPLFFDDFLSTLSVEDTEIFRDPEMWKSLIQDIIPKIGQQRARIWVAGSISGEELASMLIAINEAQPKQKPQVICSTLSERRLEKMKGGVFDIRKLDSNKNNFERIAPKAKFDNYFKTANNYIKLSHTLLENVEFRKLNLATDSLPSEIDLLHYRNQMLYFNRVLQHDILKRLHSSLVPNGYLIIGNKESIASFNIYDSFKTVNKNEGIYRRPKS